MTVVQPLTPSRRAMLLSVPAMLAVPPVPSRALPVAARPVPVLDQPMRRLRLPKGTVGRDYVLLQLRLAGQGPFDFMVDTGLTAELITPHLRSVLGIPSANQRLERGLGAGGAVQGAELVSLKDARLVGAEDLELPSLTAVVTDFIQGHLDPQHPVEGMLGMELLGLFDTDLDFPAQRIRLYRPGEGTAAAAAAGLVEVPAAVLNETGILGLRATSPQAQAAGRKGSSQPFVGILDCGASFSALNWQAAALAGLPPKGDKMYKPTGPSGQPSGGGVYTLGVDGKPQLLPLASVQFTWAGNASKDKGGELSFEQPPHEWRPWQPVQAAVGELPIFSQLLGDGVTPFKGPAALMGLDVLAQRRVVFGAGTGKSGRGRQLFVSPS